MSARPTNQTVCPYPKTAFPLFQRYCLNHVNATLAEMGVLKGTTTEPWSEIWMGQKTGVLAGPGKKNNLVHFGDKGRQHPIGKGWVGPEDL